MQNQTAMIIGSIKEKRAAATDLQLSLDRSLRILEVCPGAFGEDEGQGCAIEPTGKRVLQARGSDLRHILRATIKREDGVEFSISGEDYGYIRTGERREYLTPDEMGG